MNSQPSLQATAQKNIRLQSLVNLLSGATFLTPVITLYYTQKGLAIPQIILLANIATLSMFLLELPTSVYADITGQQKSLLYSVSCHFFGLLCLFLFPNMIGFVFASFFSALYFPFWSGTGQAFLDENLRVLGKEKLFGK